MYDGHNRRVRVSDNLKTEHSLYTQDGTLLYRENESGGINYVYLGNKLVAKIGQTESPNGNAQHFRPFGSSIEGETNDVGYTGHKFDTDIELSYMQARYYDPVIGRFYSNDPVGYTPQNPVMSFNRYMYVNNNPYKYTDPNGEYLESLWDAASLSVGLVNLGSNLANGNWGAAALDAVGVVADGVALALPIVPGGAGIAISGSRAVANEVPSTLARVVPGDVNPSSLGAPGAADVFVTDAKALEGLNSSQIADKLTIPQSSTGFNVIEFSSDAVSGIASPIARDNPGFVQGGRTAGGAPEFVIPNGKIPDDATMRHVDP